jgi:hypothetical protein
LGPRRFPNVAHVRTRRTVICLRMPNDELRDMLSIDGR